MTTHLAGLRRETVPAAFDAGAFAYDRLVGAPQAEITAIDASGQMPARARAKPWPASVTFVHTAVEHLAAAGVRGPFDAIFAAYLIRNVPDPDAPREQG